MKHWLKRVWCWRKGHDTLYVLAGEPEARMYSFCSRCGGQWWETSATTTVFRGHEYAIWDLPREPIRGGHTWEEVS